MALGSGDNLGNPGTYSDDTTDSDSDEASSSDNGSDSSESETIEGNGYTVREDPDGGVIIEDSTPDAPTGDVGDVELEEPEESTGQETRTDMGGSEYSDPDDGGSGSDGALDSAAEWANEQRDNVRDTVGDAVDSATDRAGDIRDQAGETVGDTTDRVSSGVDSATETADNIGSGIGDAVDNTVDAGQDAVDQGVSGVQSGIDSAQETADDAVRDATGGAVGVSDDFTSTDDSGGVGNVIGEGASQVIDPVVDAGEDFQQTRAEEGEQFGDWDWEVGGHDLEEGARDLRGGAREFGGTVGGAAGKVGVLPAALNATGRDQAANQLESFSRGAGEGVGDLIGGAPSIGMEGAEMVGYTFGNPRESASKVPGAAAASAVGTARQFRENPARATGSLVSQTLLGVGVAKGAGAATRSVGGGARSPLGSTRSSSGTRSPRTLTGDNRGQMSIGRIGRSDRDSPSSTSSGRSGSDGGDSILPDNIDDMLENMERGSSIREANKRAEQKTTKKRLEEGRRQERGDEPRTVDTRPGGDYEAPDGPGGDYTAPRGPDTSRSGPTRTQTQTRRGSGGDSDLSPRETQLAAQLGRETPSIDLRGVDATRRGTPDTDLRDVEAEGPNIPGFSSAAAGGGAGSLGAFSGDPVAEMTGLRDQAQTPQVTADDSGPSGTDQNVGFPTFDNVGDTAGGMVGEVDDTIGGMLGPVEDPTEGTGTTTGQTPGSRGDSGTDTGTDTGTIIDSVPTTDTGTETGTDTDTQTDTDVPPIVDTGPAQPPNDGGSPPVSVVPPADPPGLSPPTRNPPGFPRDPGSPRDPDRGRPRRIPMPDIDPGSNRRKKDEFGFEGVADTVTTDFVDPLSGEVIETENNDG